MRSDEGPDWFGRASKQLAVNQTQRRTDFPGEFRNLLMLWTSNEHLPLCVAWNCREPSALHSRLRLSPQMRVRRITRYF